MPKFIDTPELQHIEDILIATNFSLSTPVTVMYPDYTEAALTIFDILKPQ